VQFKAAFLRAAPPTTLEGIERYLGSGMSKGIGPVYGRKLVQAFGEAVFEIIEREPGRLKEVHGIGPKRVERIVAGWAEQKVIRAIMLFLHGHGVGTSRAVRICGGRSPSPTLTEGRLPGRSILPIQARPLGGRQERGGDMGSD
jgi:exodeoxyribonuclease V alpha subunit